ncbi:Zinc metalloproteinase nas-15 [Folsomia candida]|uniref:Metalloendopeptidase n=1 Tax=Folsomia candida TaxID=158441 RepID=A0A226DSM6_FOLCA|nr:Zinc metalloproteinase nas-15 [Folsomia candida]
MRTHKTMEIIILALFLILEVTFGAPLENGKHIFRDPIAPGYVKFGDMILPENFTMDGRNAIPYDQFRWPLGELPYVIDPSVSFQEYHAKTCIRFVPKQSSQRNYIRIFAGQGCYSNVGMINQGEQPVSLGQGCMIKGTVVHELGHAIGFFHEQNRSDRDENLVIYWANIQTGPRRALRYSSRIKSDSDFVTSRFSARFFLLHNLASALVQLSGGFSTPSLFRTQSRKFEKQRCFSYTLAFYSSLKTP